MRRVLLMGLFVALGASAGCLTPEDKKQWNAALGDLRGDNIKTIAPLSKNSPNSQKSSTSPSSSSSE
ncbi:hypothetical protein [Frigoriglobus tundricola]|uniref:Uncharacterized protein n=1 Tax=Frigoriglobus tundricola TaxID=2774151 RepID=A0A6M5YRS5_9BACT|nr:hypothetical protein [Frigoriglobus tundricola]QJW95961.1 hypothetical protein FTUN_3515 [Frigoriglobus tundricola]